MKFPLNKKDVVVFLLLSLNLLVMLLISWRKWADIWIDYGREPYTAWLLASGKPLYISVDCLYGPLANYLNAAIFKLSGPGLIYLSLWNIFLIVVFSVIVYKFFCRHSGRTAAVLCVASFYSIFAFSQYTFMGSLNFVCPYTHSMTYGVMLSISCCFALCYYFETNQLKFLLLAGFLCGLVFLTKAEAFMAAFGACILALSVVCVRDWKKKPWLPWSYLAFCGAVLLPILVACLALGVQMPFGVAVNGVFFQYELLAAGGMPSNTHYSSVMGIGDVVGNIRIMMLRVWVYLLIGGGGIFAARVYAWLGTFNLQLRRWVALMFWGGLCSLGASHLILKVEWVNALRGLPAFLVLLFIVYSLRLFGKLRKPDASTGQDFAFWLLTVFSLLLLAKVILNVWLGHYAFALAVPGTFMLVIFFTREVPGMVRNCEGKNIALGFVGGIMLLALTGFVRNSAFVYRVKTYQVSSGADAMLDYPPQYFSRGYVMNSAIEFVRRTMKSSDSFAVLPGSAMLNYLTRHASPCKFIAFNEADLSFQDKNIADVAKAILAVPLDYIFLVSSSWFQTKEGHMLYTVLGQNYGEVGILGLKQNGKFKNDHIVLVLSKSINKQ